MWRWGIGRQEAGGSTSRSARIAMGAEIRQEATTGELQGEETGARFGGSDRLAERGRWRTVWWHSLDRKNALGAPGASTSFASSSALC